MSKNFQISYVIDAVDKASATINAVEKRLNNLNRSFESSNKKMSKSSTKSAADYKKMALVYVQSDSAIEKARKQKLNEFIKDAKAEESLENKRIKLADQRARAVENDARNAQRALDRKLREEQRFAKEQARIRSQNISSGYSAARTSMAYVAAPTIASAALSLRNTMTIEQLKIRLLTQFGDEGNKVFKESAKYALQTAFSMKDAVGLITDLKIGSANIGVKTTDELLSMSRSVGNTLLAFTTNKEDRQEVVNQLGQIAMAGQASFRQDILVMNRRGLPIIQAIEDFTGQKYKALQEKYGANLPAKLIYDSLMNLSKSDKIITAMALRSQSLTQSWDSLAESMFFFSSDYGNVLSQKFELPAVFKSAANLLQEMSADLQTNDKVGNTFAKSMATFGTSLAISVPALLTASFLISKIWDTGAKAAGSSALFRGRILSASGAMSALYLTTVDWQSLINDIKDGGLAGWTKHLDVVIASALTLLSTIKLIQAASVMAAGAGLLGFLGAATGGVAVAGYAGYKAGEAFGESTYADKVLNLYYETTGEKLKMTDPSIRERNERNKTPEIKLEVHNNTVVDKSGHATTATKVKKHYNTAPVTSNLWSK